MKKILNTALLLTVASLMASCATKRFDRLQPVSATEAQYLNCREIKIELAKVAEARRQVAEGSRVDLASVAGFLGDFGIGNAMEKNAAERTIAERETSLLDLKAKKGCR